MQIGKQGLLKTASLLVNKIRNNVNVLRDIMGETTGIKLEILIVLDLRM